MCVCETHVRVAVLMWVGVHVRVGKTHVRVDMRVGTGMRNANSCLTNLLGRRLVLVFSISKLAYRPKILGVIRFLNASSSSPSFATSSSSSMSGNSYTYPYPIHTHTPSHAHSHIHTPSHAHSHIHTPSHAHSDMHTQGTHAQFTCTGYTHILNRNTQGTHAQFTCTHRVHTHSHTHRVHTHSHTHTGYTHKHTWYKHIY